MKFYCFHTIVNCSLSHAAWPSFSMLNRRGLSLKLFLFLFITVVKYNHARSLQICHFYDLFRNTNLTIISARNLFGWTLESHMATLTGPLLLRATPRPLRVRPNLVEVETGTNLVLVTPIEKHRNKLWQKWLTLRLTTLIRWLRWANWKRLKPFFSPSQPHDQPSPRLFPKARSLSRGTRPEKLKSRRRNQAPRRQVFRQALDKAKIVLSITIIRPPILEHRHVIAPEFLNLTPHNRFLIFHPSKNALVLISKIFLFPILVAERSSDEVTLERLR